MCVGALSSLALFPIETPHADMRVLIECKRGGMFNSNQSNVARLVYDNKFHRIIPIPSDMPVVIERERLVLDGYRGASLSRSF